MEWYVETLINELQDLIADLGIDGGAISPSIYDTAQVLRLYPPPHGVEPGLDWLVSQQQPDGGWGDPAVPLARSIPTLAAILALHKYRADRRTGEIVAAALGFLRRSADLWQDVHIDAVPIAGEMILPYLLDEARRTGLMIARKPYARLFEMRARKIRRLARMKIRAGTAPTYSWEAFGTRADPRLLDATGGVGHSPAATAAWLHLACRGRPKAARAWPVAENYLQRAHIATGVDVPGIMPVVHPISGFELSYGPYAMMIAGIFHNSAFCDALEGPILVLSEMIRRGNGLSFGEHFVPDVDDTSVGVSVLRTAGYEPDVDLIMQFHRMHEFFTYQFELNPSVFSNAHALHALSHCDRREISTEKRLVSRQAPDGHWIADKWHTSWRYTTLEAIIALLPLGYSHALEKAKGALLRGQNSDGSWDDGFRPSYLETAYTVLALRVLQQGEFLGPDDCQILKRAEQWLQCNLHLVDQVEYRWLGKETYSPHRVDRAYKLSALLSIEDSRLPDLTQDSTFQRSASLALPVG